MLLYNNPAGTGYSLSPRFIAELSRMPEVIAIKDTTHQAARIEEIRHLCGKRVQILSGQDTLQYVGFVAGARAAVWGAPNAVPAACAELFERIGSDPGQADPAGGRPMRSRRPAPSCSSASSPAATRPAAASCGTASTR